MLQQRKSGARVCTHRNPWELRLITYTRYGAMVGCLRCGTSWLVSSYPLPDSSYMSGGCPNKQ
jgi:hypothetical protein